jgi:hypothetical protein
MLHNINRLDSVAQMSPVRYELGFYIPQDVNIFNYRPENLKSYLAIFLRGSCKVVLVFN